MSQDLNPHPSVCSSLAIFMYWVSENRTFNAVSTEKS